MENQLIGYELFVNSKLYPDDYIVSYNHKLYTSEDDAKMALKDLRNHLGKSFTICYRPVYLTYITTGKYVLQRIYYSQELYKSEFKKRVYNLRGINDYKTDCPYKHGFKLEEEYNIYNIKYGEPIF